MTESKPSKSARKREQQALQELGEQLIALSDAELSTMPLDEPLREAIRVAKSIRSRGALRRQRQYIGKLMREVEPQPIRAELARLRADDMHLKHVFAQAERWRDRIVRDGDPALTAFESEYVSANGELQNLLRELNAACSDNAEKIARRKIFRHVHEILVRIAQ